MRRALILAAAAAAAALAAPAQAAEAVDGTESDLRCVAWSAFAGSLGKTEQEKQATMMVMLYFIGRWESVTGKGIDSALTPEWTSANFAQILAAGPDCQERGKQVATRMKSAGSKLKDATKK